MPVHDQIDRLVRVEHRSHTHKVRMRYLCEHRPFEREPVQCAEEIALAIRRVGSRGRAIGTTRDEIPREEFLDDDRIATQLVFREIAEREWARSTNGTNTVPISDQCSRTKRKRVVRLLNVSGHTHSGARCAKVIAQGMPV